MNRNELTKAISQKGSYLCVGLDTDPSKIPNHLKGTPAAVYRFNRAIIDATKENCVAYKINTAFYESQGVEGLKALQMTLDCIPPGHFKIADAKRADIGNTSSQYAKAFFETMHFDAVTVAPYMGEDSIRPFLEYKNKITIVLGLTSNKGSNDFQRLKLEDGSTLYEKVLRTAASWGTPENMMFVVGATQASDLAYIRTIIPEHFLLVPGVGAQGGSLSEVSEYGMTRDCGLLVNSSREIIYASPGEDFDIQAGIKTKSLQIEMKAHLKTYLIDKFF